MANELQVQVIGLKELIHSMQMFGGDYAREIRTFLHKAGLAVQREAQHRTPVATGTLRRSMAVKVDSSNPPVFAKIGTNMPYGPFIEYGERRGKRGIIKRRLGPARMLRDGAAAAGPIINGLIVETGKRLLARMGK
jgi:hypothetical protein